MWRMKPKQAEIKPIASDVRAILCLGAMLLSVLIICQGTALIGIPAFVLSLIPLLKTSAATL